MKNKKYILFSFLLAFLSFSIVLVNGQKKEDNFQLSSFTWKSNPSEIKEQLEKLGYVFSENDNVNDKKIIAYKTLTKKETLEFSFNRNNQLKTIFWNFPSSKNKGVEYDLIQEYGSYDSVKSFKYGNIFHFVNEQEPLLIEYILKDNENIWIKRNKNYKTLNQEQKALLKKEPDKNEWEKYQKYNNYSFIFVHWEKEKSKNSTVIFHYNYDF